MKVPKNKQCFFCKEHVGKYGNNCWPFGASDKDRCCTVCNWKFVVPARLMDMEKFYEK